VATSDAADRTVDFLRHQFGAPQQYNSNIKGDNA
jgi:hypothetical protein